MYCDFYQLTERPFNVTPDPKFLYLNARYREALASLNYGITQRKGFITLIGEAGTGKTTLLKRLLEDLDPKTKTVFIFNTNVTFEEILEYILAEFDLPVHNGKKLYMLQRLNTFLLEELRGAGNVALLIDEAQDLEFSVLEDLRLLSNLETAKEKILQIVLSGQPELGQKLSNPVLRQLRQRIGINCRLLPLSRDEITEYIEYRLQAAQCPDLKLFTREAEDQVYHFSRGIPRLVNVVCDNALVIGYALGKKRIAEDIIKEAAADLLSLEARSEEPKEPTASPVAPAAWSAPKPPRRNARLGVIGLFVVALMIGLLSIGRTMLTRPAMPLPFSGQMSSFEVIRPGSNPRGAGVDPPADVPAAIGGQENALVEAGSPAAIAEAPVVAAVAPRDPAPRDRDTIETLPRSRNVEEGWPTGQRERTRGDDIESGVPPLAGSRSAPTAATPPSRAVVAARDPETQGKVTTKPEVRERAAVDPGEGAAGQEGAVASDRRVAAVPLPEGSNSGAEGGGPLGAGERVVASTSAGAPVRPAPADAPKKPEAPRAAPARAASVADESDEEVAPKIDPAPPVDSRVESTHGLAGVEFGSQVVRVGDSVSGIAMRKYGQASYTVLDLLKIANPEVEDIDAISVGQTIRLPELGEGYPILKEGGGKYSLLVVSSPQLRKATALQAALRGKGFDARVASTSVGNGKPLYRVVIGGYSGHEKVAAAGKQVQKLFRENAALAELAE